MAFQYDAFAKGDGTATTRVASQGNVTTPQIVAAVAAENPTATPELITAIGTSIFRQVILLGARESKTVLRLFDLYSFRPACGGEFPDLDFQPTAESMNLAVRGNVAPAGQTLFETGLIFVRRGTVGEKTAHIERVYNASSNSTNTYTAGGGYKLNGDFFGTPDLTNINMGVFLKSVATGIIVRCPSIIDWTGTEISGAWANGITGPQTLILVTQYSPTGGARTTIYGTPLG